MLVIPVSDAWNPSLVIRAHTTTKLHELNTALDGSRGGWRCKLGASIDAVGVEIGAASVARGGKTHFHTHTNTGIND